LTLRDHAILITFLPLLIVEGAITVVASQHSPIQMHLGVLLAGLVAPFLFTLTATTVLGRNLITRLHRLGETVNRVAQGQDPGPPMAGSDEIADLDHAFRRMTRILTERDRELARYVLFSKNLREAIIFFDCESTTIIDANDAAIALHGYSHDEFLRLNALDLRPHEDRETLVRDAGEVDVPGKSYEYTALRKDGSTFPAESTPQTTVFDGRRIVVSVIRDISERRNSDEMRRARDHALANSDQKSTYLATTSHEIRTPMNGIIGMTELLLETNLNETQREFAETIDDTAHTLLHLIDEVLNISKIEAGKVELEEIDFSPARKTERVIRLLAPGARKKNVRLDLSVASDVPALLRGDPFRIRQIMLNLVGNAIKFTHAGSIEIDLAAKDLPDGAVELRFSVKDTGIGISAENLAKLFQSFTQANSSTTRQYGGSGLGLVIARHLGRLMGGDITVESEPAVGTTATFTGVFQKAHGTDISVISDPAVEHSLLSAGQAAHRSRSGTKPRVLLAEDNAVNRLVLSKRLASLGYAVVTVDNGKEAVQAAREGIFDVILMDCDMPEMDGYAATRAIRALEKHRGKRTPIIALTASVAAEDRRLCVDAGMDDFLTKPLTREMLGTAIERCLSLHTVKPPKEGAA
jgi:PAS domain S-box-containing protein